MYHRVMEFCHKQLRAHEDRQNVPWRKRVRNCFARGILFCVLIGAIVLSSHSFQNVKPARFFARDDPTRPSAAGQARLDLTSRNASSTALRLTDAHALQKNLHDIQVTLFRKLFLNYRKAIIFDLADIENKGDPAISLGELRLLGELNISIIYYCSYDCSSAHFQEAREIAAGFPLGEVVILSSGGGNFGGYPSNDYERIRVLQAFPKHKVVVFPQSIWLRYEMHEHHMVREYNAHPDLTIVVRDEKSYNLTREKFPRVEVLLAPDMAFSIGGVRRFLPPLYDIVWLRREDAERPDVYDVSFPPNISHVVSDWSPSWPSPAGRNLIDDTFSMTYNGLLFELRGRVLVTDRLHGHILATLVDLPTVIIDNSIKKISNLRNTWTKGLSRVVMAADSKDACTKAVQLLEQYGPSLPPSAPGQWLRGHQVYGLEQDEAWSLKSMLKSLFKSLSYLWHINQKFVSILPYKGVYE